MGEKTEQAGGCLCGKVRFWVANRAAKAGACHCQSCRRWAGGPLIAIDCGDAVDFEDEKHIVRYRSSDWAERGFCGTCGSNLFYRLVQSGQYMMCAGAFDDQSDLELVSQVFIYEKPDYYAFANETETMTGAELFAKFAPPGGGEE